MDAWISVLLGLYFAVSGIFILFLLLPVRKRLYILLLHGKNTSMLRVAFYYEQNLHFLIIWRQILLFFLPLCVALAIFGVDTTKQQLTSLFVLGLSINVFWVAQLSLLTKAHLYIDFGIDQLKDLKTEITVNAESEHTIYTRAYNLGFTTLKNAVFLIYFGEGFAAVPYDDARYLQLDFSKHFSVQKGNCGVAFMPTHDNYQSLPPQEWFLFPVIVKSPKSLVRPDVEIQVYSENSWGLTKYHALIHLTKES